MLPSPGAPVSTGIQTPPCPSGTIAIGALRLLISAI